jgi:hypothetical protein
MALTLPAFPHRLNRDGSFDSICLTCLLTITNARMEAELATHEQNHVCDPSILYQRAFDLTHSIRGFHVHALTAEACQGLLRPN